MNNVLLSNTIFTLYWNHSRQYIFIYDISLSKFIQQNAASIKISLLGSLIAQSEMKIFRQLYLACLYKVSTELYICQIGTL